MLIKAIEQKRRKNGKTNKEKFQIARIEKNAEKALKDKKELPKPKLTKYQEAQIIFSEVLRKQKKEADRKNGELVKDSDSDSDKTQNDFSPKRLNTRSKKQIRKLMD